MSDTMSGGSTRPNVRTFAHITADPAAAAIAPSHESTPTLIHAGDNGSRASSCRVMRSAENTAIKCMT